MHSEMSFLGAIGELMGRTGLQEMLEVIMLIQQSVMFNWQNNFTAYSWTVFIEAVLYAIILIYKFLSHLRRKKEKKIGNRSEK